LTLLDQYEEQELERTIACRSAVAKTTNVDSINGLTGNPEGWEKLIDHRLVKWTNTVFSAQAAEKLREPEPGFNCMVRLKDGVTMKRQKLYDMPRDQLLVLKEWIDEQLRKGFIRRSDSSFASPVFFVTDGNSPGKKRPKQLRLVIDYRALNAIVEQDQYPVPLAREIISFVSDPTITHIAVFDVRYGFSNIRNEPGHEKYFAFQTPWGLFEPLTMQMGYGPAPSIFQRKVDAMMQKFPFVKMYLDDGIIVSRSEEEHLHHCTLVLETLEKEGFHLKPQKCKWFQTEVDFLGYHIVAGKGVTMSSEKQDEICNAEPPNTKRDLQAFNGLVNFYGKFVPHFADTMKPLYYLLEKDVPFTWEKHHQDTFDEVKRRIKEEVFFRAFDYDKLPVLETDASGWAIGGIISQYDENGDLRPVICDHRTLSKEERNWHAHDREMIAIVWFLEKYKHFFLGARDTFPIYCDHRALASFRTTTDLNKDVKYPRWLQKLSRFNFQIQYRPGKENVAADFITRYNFSDSREKLDLPLLPSYRWSEKAWKSFSHTNSQKTRKSLDPPPGWQATAA